MPTGGVLRPPVIDIQKLSWGGGVSCDSPYHQKMAQISLYWDKSGLTL